MEDLAKRKMENSTVTKKYLLMPFTWTLNIALLKWKACCLFQILNVYVSNHQRTVAQCV